MTEGTKKEEPSVQSDTQNERKMEVWGGGWGGLGEGAGGGCGSKRAALGIWNSSVSVMDKPTLIIKLYSTYTYSQMNTSQTGKL